MAEIENNTNEELTQIERATLSLLPEGPAWNKNPQSNLSKLMRALVSPLEDVEVETVKISSNFFPQTATKEAIEILQNLYQTQTQRATNKQKRFAFINYWNEKNYLTVAKLQRALVSSGFEDAKVYLKETDEDFIRTITTNDMGFRCGRYISRCGDEDVSRCFNRRIINVNYDTFLIHAEGSDVINEDRKYDHMIFIIAGQGRRKLQIAGARRQEFIDLVLRYKPVNMWALAELEYLNYGDIVALRQRATDLRSDIIDLHFEIDQGVADAERAYAIDPSIIEDVSTFALTAVMESSEINVREIKDQIAVKNSNLQAKKIEIEGLIEKAEIILRAVEEAREVYLDIREYADSMQLYADQAQYFLERVSNILYEAEDRAIKYNEMIMTSDHLAEGYARVSQLVNEVVQEQYQRALVPEDAKEDIQEKTTEAVDSIVRIQAQTQIPFGRARMYTRVFPSFNEIYEEIESYFTNIFDEKNRALQIDRLITDILSDPFYAKILIRTVEELQAIHTNPAYKNSEGHIEGNFILVNNLNIGDSISNFIPIGTNYDDPFVGKFDGNGFEISNLNITVTPNKSNQGLFGWATGAELKNIRIVSGNIIGARYSERIGAIVGSMTGGSLSGYNAATISGWGDIGGLVGRAASGTTEIVGYNLGNITGTGNNVGGLVGFLREGSITGYNEGAIVGNSNVGGLAGYSPRTTGYNRGTVTATFRITSSGARRYTGDSIGGLVGLGGITKGYNEGDVTGNEYVGGLVGKDPVIVIGYNTGNISADDEAGGLLGAFLSTRTGGTVVGYNTGSISSDRVFPAELFGRIPIRKETPATVQGYGATDSFLPYNPAIYPLVQAENRAVLPPIGSAQDAYGFLIYRDFTFVSRTSNNLGWVYSAEHHPRININVDWPNERIAPPQGIMVDPFFGKTQVSTPEQLKAIATDAQYRDDDGNIIAKIVLTANLDFTGINDYRPIGNFINQFKGTFDGNGFTIKNLHINHPNANYVGLFGFVDIRGKIKNVKFVSGSVIGAAYVGSIVGYVERGTVTGSNYASVTGTGDCTGGLVGNMMEGVVIGINHGIISDGTGDKIGGLVGCIEGGMVTGYNTAEVNGRNSVGGLVGNIESGEVVGYNTGIVSGTARMAGKLAGRQVGGTVAGYAYAADDNSPFVSSKFGGQSDRIAIFPDIGSPQSAFSFLATEALPFVLRSSGNLGWIYETTSYPHLDL